LAPTSLDACGIFADKQFAKLPHDSVQSRVQSAERERDTQAIDTLIGLDAERHHQPTLWMPRSFV